MNIGVHYLFEPMLSYLLGMYFGVELLEHMMILSVTFQKLSNYSPYWLHHFVFLLEIRRDSNSPMSSPIFVISCFFFMMTILMGLKCYSGFGLYCLNDK